MCNNNPIKEMKKIKLWFMLVIVLNLAAAAHMNVEDRE